MAKDTLTVRFHLEADFETIQAIRQALADEWLQTDLVSRRRETAFACLTPHLAADFTLTGTLKVSALSRSRSGPRLPLPTVVDDRLSWYDPDADLTTVVGLIGSVDCLTWLEETNTTSFRYESEAGSFTAIREKRRGRPVWYAHRRRNGRLKRVYLGLTHNLISSGSGRCQARGQSQLVSLRPEIKGGSTLST